MDCYKTCDIRGRYPDEINEELFFQFGRNIALKFLEGRAILIGADVRMSSPSLKQALSEGLVSAGAKVFDAGQAPTPVISFGKRKLGVYAAAIVTASHNPPEDNGLKLLLGRYPATAAQLRALKPDGAARPSTGVAGKVESVYLADPYVEFLVSTWRDRLHSAGSSGTPGKYVFDPGNGTWSLLIGEIIRRLDISATLVNAGADGRFPGRSPDCAAPGNLLALTAEVRRTGATAGLAWDGDGDRLAVCDNTGRVLFTDHLALLMLPAMLGGNRREKILVDVRMSRKIKIAIVKHGGIPILERSAHCHLEHRMILEDCLFGCEYSGHLFFRSLGGADDGMYAALAVVDYLCHRTIPLSDLLLVIPELWITPDLRIPSSDLDFSEIRCRLREAFPGGNISEFDGFRVETPGAWVLVRPAVSENKLSFRLEGESQEDLEFIIDRVLTFLPQCAPLLEVQIRPWKARA